MHLQEYFPDLKTNNPNTRTYVVYVRGSVFFDRGFIFAKRSLVLSEPASKCHLFPATMSSGAAIRASQRSAARASSQHYGTSE